MALPEGTVTVTGWPEPTVDGGTDGNVRYITQTQGTPGLNINAVTAASDEITANISGAVDINFDTSVGLAATPFSSSGVGSVGDDSGKVSTSNTNQAINADFNKGFSAQPNILDQYASYTYSLSWYLLSPTQFNITTGMFNDESQNGLNTANWTLIMQSGGASAQVADATHGGRSPYFTEDYYMDNLVIRTELPAVQGGGTGAAIVGGDIEFTVTEPNGITLINNLAGAVQNIYKADINTVPNPDQVFYALVIKFYGYDSQGNLVTAGTNNNGPRAVVTKVYPFVIKDIGFRLANRIIEYKVRAASPGYIINASTRRGTIPCQFELVGETVGDILGGGNNGKPVNLNDGRENETSAVKTNQAQAPDRTQNTPENPFATSGGNDTWNNYPTVAPTLILK